MVAPNCHTIHSRDGGTVTLQRAYTARLAIRLFCTKCLGWEDHPRDCTDPLCELFPYRGKSLLAHKGE